MNDLRANIYKDLHNRHQTQPDLIARRATANLVFRTVYTHIPPGSVLDVGCGMGVWLAIAETFGVKDFTGIDGPWVDPSSLLIPQDRFISMDLDKGFDLGRRFDLVVSLEVAEHLPPEAADRFIASLVRHGRAVLFSAAIPHQGGHHHVNEQFLPYWAERFLAHGYVPLDFIRPAIWERKETHQHIRQNVVLFCAADYLKDHPSLQKAMANAKPPLSMVHPSIYANRVAMWKNRYLALVKMEKLLRQGGTFRTVVNENGGIVISRLPD